LGEKERQRWEKEKGKVTGKRKAVMREIERE
jgi:hypothetical protein